jgi:hypothetical protein
MKTFLDEDEMDIVQEAMLDKIKEFEEYHEEIMMRQKGQKLTKTLKEMNENRIRHIEYLSRIRQKLVDMNEWMELSENEAS